MAESFFGAKAVEGEGAAAGGSKGALLAFDSGAESSLNAGMASVAAGKLGAAGWGEDLGIEGIGRARSTESETLPTGIASLDRVLEGGLSAGVLTEFVESGASCGGQVLLLHLLESMRGQRKFVALVDASDGFDPESTPPELLEHLLWARCGSAREALRVADVVLRDENLGMVVLDLRGCLERDLRQAKATDWYRLQRLAGARQGYACVLTPQAMVPSAQTRARLGGRLGLELADASTREQGAAMAWEVLRLRKREPQEFPNLVERHA